MLEAFPLAQIDPQIWLLNCCCLQFSTPSEHTRTYFFVEEKKEGKEAEKEKGQGKKKPKYLMETGKFQNVTQILEHSLPSIAVCWFNGGDDLVRGFAAKDSCELQ